MRSVIGRAQLTRRESSGVCPVCGLRVLRLEVRTAPAGLFLASPGRVVMLVDPGILQQFVADIMVGAAALRGAPPWNWSPGYPMPHECPPLGQGPLAELARREA